MRRRGWGPPGLLAPLLAGSALRVILRYAPNTPWLSSQPAALRRTYGRGEITYLGALLDPQLMRNFLGRSLAAAGIPSSAETLPPDVELMRRYGEGREIAILINHGPSARTVALPNSMRDVLHPGPDVREVTLGAQGVAVLERRAPTQ